MPHSREPPQTLVRLLARTPGLGRLRKLSLHGLIDPEAEAALRQRFGARLSVVS